VFVADSLAAAFACFFGFAVFALGLGASAFEPAADSCATAIRGEMQAQAQTNASARVHPAPSQFRFFAQCFRFSSNGNPQPSEVLRRSTVLLLLARLSAPKVFAR
jgi:hypothetical protein